MLMLEVESKKALSEIESTKFKKTIEAVGAQTLVEIARSGPETQAKLLKGLGLKGFMISDGKNPINLFNTANGMLGSFMK
jgi:major vault protein